MNYKTVSHGETRYIVVDDVERYRLEKKVTPNLNKNELIITFLRAKDCPANESCVYPHYELTSICREMGCYPGSHLNDVGEYLLLTQRITCNHNDSTGNLEVTILRAENCPEKREDCIRCKHLKKIIIPSEQSPEKAHACAVCGAVKTKA